MDVVKKMVEKKSVEDKPVDMQYEESITKEQHDKIVETAVQDVAEEKKVLNDRLKAIAEDQHKIVDTIEVLTKFTSDLVKPEYTEKDKDGKDVKKTGALWQLIIKAKKIGAF